MKTSIIINVFNRSQFLEKALLALYNQNQNIDELIISDDGSSEDIESIVEKFAKTVDYKVKFISQEHNGFRLAKCRNNAIRAAEGDFLIFIDQDIIYTKKYIKTYLENCRPGFFLVSYPVRLTENQTEMLDENIIKKADFSEIIKANQIKKIHSQFFWDGFEYYLKKIISNNRYKPKLRGGICAMFKSDLLKVDGYDENFQGWGNEDDDLGRRLYKAGIKGKNPFYDEYPIHLYHEPFHIDGERVNQEYYRRRKIEIANGDYKAVNGISNPITDEEIKVVAFN